VPELPEVEITARRLNKALEGAEIESALAPGMVTMKTFDPPLDVLAGRKITRVGRAGKMLIVEAGDLSLLIHLMSAGRLQLWDKRASLRDRASRLLVRIGDGRELRLREFGTQQRAWAKLLPTGDLEQDESVATLGPDAWPAPPLEEFAERIAQPRHLHSLLRDQRAIAGIGRAHANEILLRARLSPFKASTELSEEELERLDDAIRVDLSRALELRERGKDDKAVYLVHNRLGEPCPQCGTPIARVDYEEHTVYYCPTCQTGGRVLKDRRLSRLLR
jgi:formamidopyrimidine-DNA glycosylase